MEYGDEFRVRAPSSVILLTILSLSNLTLRLTSRNTVSSSTVSSACRTQRSSCRIRSTRVDRR
jgi:hypothetical protein